MRAISSVISLTVHVAVGAAVLFGTTKTGRSDVPSDRVRRECREGSFLKPLSTLPAAFSRNPFWSCRGLIPRLSHQRDRLCWLRCFGRLWLAGRRFRCGYGFRTISPYETAWDVGDECDAEGSSGCHRFVIYELLAGFLRRVLLLSQPVTSPGGTAVFNHLIESNRKTNKKGAFGLGFISLIGHSVVVLAAGVATLTAGQKKDEQTIDTAMVFLNQDEQKKPEEQPPVVDVPQLKGFQTVVAPTDIPTNIPPINLQEHFDPKDYTGTGVEGGIGTGIVPSSDQVFMESVVEERPEVLSGPALNYPDLLRQAGVQGRVLVQAIIDTSGRAEPPSVKIIQSPNPGFDQSAKNYVLRALFRPARVHGRAVRVLVNLPIDFKISRR